MRVQHEYVKAIIFGGNIGEINMIMDYVYSKKKKSV